MRTRILLLWLIACPLLAWATVAGRQLVALARAERDLGAAATAGACEAALPRATPTSIAAAVRRSLERASRTACHEQMSITIDGRTIPAIGWVPLAAGCQVAVYLSLPVTNLVPDSLQAIGLSIDGKHLIASAARYKP